MVLEDPELKDLDGDPLHLGEIQALGEQVVGPGSLHPNGNYYKVIADVPIATVDKDFLLELIKPFVKKRRSTDIQEMQNTARWIFNRQSHSDRSSCMATKDQRKERLRGVRESS